VAPGGAGRENVATDARSGDLGVQLGYQLFIVGDLATGGLGLVAPLLGFGAVFDPDELLLVGPVGLEDGFVLEVPAFAALGGA
jgi:hypothetical protein